MGDREEGGKDGGGRWRHELVLDTGDDRDPLKISSVCVCVYLYLLLCLFKMLTLKTPFFDLDITD